MKIGRCTGSNPVLTTKLKNKVNMEHETDNGTNPVLAAVKWVSRQFGHIWCLFVHGLIRDKHKTHKAYGPEECQICGRWWGL